MFFVGITTAPRKNPTVFDTCDSVESLGWKPHLFAEPDSPLPENVWVHQNQSQLGVWRNWVNMCRWVLSETNEPYIVLLQDDVSLHPETAKFCEQILPKLNKTVSIYTSRKYGNKIPTGVSAVWTRSFWGSCAMVFPRNILTRILSHKMIDSWCGARPASKHRAKEIYAKRKANPNMIANSDTAIGKIMDAIGERIHMVSPSLCTHTAVHSTISHGTNTGNRNADPVADFSLPLDPNVYTIHQHLTQSN